MIAYIQNLANELAKILREKLDYREDRLPWNIQGRFQEIASELRQLNARDFTIASQQAFIIIRMNMEHWAMVQNVAWDKIRCGLKIGMSGQCEGALLSIKPSVSLVELSDKTLQLITHGHSSNALRSLVDDAVKVCTDAAAVLDSYGGEGSHLRTRSFAFKAGSVA